jgi:mono/diheme cytochrome c family protein
MTRRRVIVILLSVIFLSSLLARVLPETIGRAAQLDADATQASGAMTPFDLSIDKHALSLLIRGRQIFRFDSFGDETFWGDQLHLHQAIKGAALGGVGPGLSPKTALTLGLKVDSNALPADLRRQLRQGRVNLDDPAVTVALLKLNAVVGLTGFFDAGTGGLRSVGIQCALCHSVVDNSLAPGIGQRLDGWANRDLNVGAIIAFAPSVQPLADLLGVDQATVRTVLNSWGPGKFDAELILDGKAFRPDGKSAATLIPPAYGLAGVNLHTWTGWGSVTHWNAFVSNLEMHGSGTFFDPRLNDPDQFPIAARAGLGNVRNTPDLITGKLGALHVYQLDIPAPTPPAGSFNKAAAERGAQLFTTSARCASCHVPPLYTEPGWNMHTADEIGIDAFQADRAPDRRYRTSPLKGLFAHQRGGFYHDGRFATLLDVVEHYNVVFGLNLTTAQKTDLVEYLKSL